MPRLREHPIATARLAREGQISDRTEFAGTPYQQAWPASRTFLPAFRPYKWCERKRHIVLSPEAAEAWLRFSEGRD